jgi:hypothetical protein
MSAMGLAKSSWHLVRMSGRVAGASVRMASSWGAAMGAAEVNAAAARVKTRARGLKESIVVGVKRM